MDENMRQGESRDAPEEHSALPADLSGLLGSLLGGGENAAGDGVSADAMREGIGAVLNDPQMMAKLPEMMEMLRPMLGGGTNGGGMRPSRADVQTEKPKPAGKGGGCHDRRVALLRALRPYWTGRRQEAIDYILRMDQMGKLFRSGGGG